MLKARGHVDWPTAVLSRYSCQPDEWAGRALLRLTNRVRRSSTMEAGLGARVGIASTDGKWTVALLGVLMVGHVMSESRLR
jgi:hypothetical protein